MGGRSGRPGRLGKSRDDGGILSARRTRGTLGLMELEGLPRRADAPATDRAEVTEAAGVPPQGEADLLELGGHGGEHPILGRLEFRPQLGDAGLQLELPPEEAVEASVVGVLHVSGAR